MRCPGHFDFDLNTADKASFRNHYQRPGSPFEAWSATSSALVTRVDAATWEVEAGITELPDMSGYAVALLVEVRPRPGGAARVSIAGHTISRSPSSSARSDAVSRNVSCARPVSNDDSLSGCP